MQRGCDEGIKRKYSPKVTKAIRIMANKTIGPKKWAT